MKNKKLIIVLLLVIGLIYFVGASEITGNIKLVGSSAPEVKVEAGYTVKIPVLQGEGPLFAGNNVKLKGNLGLSPIAISLTVESIFTPIAFLEISAGGVAGTGWNFDPMNLKGLAIGDGSDAVTSDSLGGIYYKGFGGAAFQFDAAALWPGEWHHIVFRTAHEISWQGYTDKAEGKGWEFETTGLHKNGLNYKGDYLVGYQMPLIINMVALLAETYLDNIKTDFAVGMTFDLGLVTNFQFTKNLSLTVIPQITNRKIDEFRKITSSDVRFKRVAAMLTYSF